ncbi:unnamed protein product [Blepharisma stoltei]|uniref:Protein kinase domain-containing protein n=1 Tax=Blepharisma stoltei TaxID=1481888 RepID=A0AAU9JXI8_9CILI|nr:unnamed protein product [Blepharisma stoltei]
MDKLAKPRSLKEIEKHLRSESSKFYDNIPSQLKDDISSFISSNKEHSLEILNPLKNVEDSIELGPEEKRALKLLIAAHSVQIYMKNEELSDKNILECKKYLEILSIEGGINVMKINQEIIDKTKEMREELEVGPEKLTKTLSGILTLPSLEDQQRDEILNLINELGNADLPDFNNPLSEEKKEIFDEISLNMEAAQRYVAYVKSQDAKKFPGLDPDFLNEFSKLILKCTDLEELNALSTMVNILSLYGSIDHISKCLQFKVRAALWKPLEDIDALHCLVLRLNLLKALKYYSNMESIYESICINGLEIIKDFEAAEQFMTAICGIHLQNDAKIKLLDLYADSQNSKIRAYIDIPNLKICSPEQVNFDSQLYNDCSRSNYLLNINKVAIFLDGKRMSAVDKCYSTRSFQEFSQFKDEIQILREFHDTGDNTFLKLYGCYYNENTEKADRPHELHIIMEFCPSTLNEEIQKRKAKKKYYSAQKILKYLDVLARGYNLLKTRRIVHRDIKPDNIFIGHDKRLKIADFNTSIKVDHTINTVNFEENYTISGTTSYFAPEMLRAYELYKRHQGDRKFIHNPLKSDVFSLGITLLEAATLENIKGLNSFSDSNLQEHINRFINEKIQDEDLNRILKSMLQVDPERRPSFRDLIIAISNAKPTEG